jgi:preprotein translocase subunit YajC
VATLCFTAKRSPPFIRCICHKDAAMLTPTLVFAQAAGGLGPLESMLPMMVMVAGIFYFLVVRPQQQKAKEYDAMLGKLRRGDTVVTSGGFVGRVSKIEDGADDVEVALNETMKVRVLKSSLQSVRSKNEPVKETT